jgi:hypothetical protein
MQSKHPGSISLRIERRSVSPIILRKDRGRYGIAKVVKQSCLSVTMRDKVELPIFIVLGMRDYLTHPKVVRDNHDLMLGA